MEKYKSAEGPEKISVKIHLSSALYFSFMHKTFYPSALDKGKRIDQFLAAQKNIHLTRSRIKKLIEEGNIGIECENIEPSYKIKGGEKILVEVPPPENFYLEAQKIPLDIVFEDNDIIIVNKKAGIVVHPGAGNPQGTLVNALLAHCQDLQGIGGKLRPGIVHRLDKDTSGLMVVAKNENSYYNLIEQIKWRSLQRKYLALVHGNVKQTSGEINFPLGRNPKNRKKFSVVKSGGKEALTFFKIKKRFKNYTLLELELSTGRTHQIRVHTSFLGYPVVGDKQYGRKSLPALGLNRQALHAYYLKLTHPQNKKEMEFKIPLPEDFNLALKKAEEEKL